MRRNMVAVCVTDEYVPIPATMGVEPKTEFGQVDAALMILGSERGHAGKMGQGSCQRNVATLGFAMDFWLRCR